MPKPSGGKPRKLVKRQVEDDYLDTDSEIDEFALEGNARAGPSGSSEEDEEDEAGDAQAEDGEEEGVGQWVPDDWEDGDLGGGSDSEEDGGGSSSEEESDEEAGDEEALRENLRQIPLATLMKAQKALKRSGKGASEARRADKDKLALAKAGLAEMQRAKGKGKEIRREGTPEDGSEDSGSEGDGAEGRKNKHAPAVMSTKRQVSRHRQAIALPKREVRDPRFSSISGSLNPHLHSQAYSFLPDLLKDEYANLRRSVAAAQKAEKTCPLREKADRTAEREQLELELGRMRTRIDRARVEEREREVLSKVKKEERGKREEGKGAWFMKKAEKKDLLLKARFEALEEAGGKRAVKKAVDKKRKKVAGKEKKSRPAGVGGYSGQGGKKRRVA